MHLILTIVVVIAAVQAITVALLISVFVIECLIAQLPDRRMTPAQKMVERPTVGVLIPAHNEATDIIATVTSILTQLQPADRLLVVADNCDDATAMLARHAGALVLERHDDRHRGKGFALAAGVDWYRLSPPAVLICFDADMPIDDGVVNSLAAQAIATGRPAQAISRLQCSASADPWSAISSLAYTVKNLVRPIALARLRIPVLLTGTGMAFPWHTVEALSIASAHLAEDKQMGIELARRGHGAVLCRLALIRGSLPTHRDVALTQRARWEHGHLELLTHTCLPLLMYGIRKRRLDLLAVSIDLAVPPLTLLVVWWMLASALTMFGALATHVRWPMYLSVAAGVALLSAVAMSWRKFASELPASILFSLPRYVVSKIPMYARFFLRRKSDWVRTARAHEVP